MFMKLGSRAGVFHQEAYVLFSKDEEVMLQWRMNFTNFMDPDLTFYCTSTPALPMPNACLPSTMKHMCSKFAQTCLFTVTFTKLHGCHCTLLKPLYSGIDVAMPKGCVSLSASGQR